MPLRHWQWFHIVSFWTCPPKVAMVPDRSHLKLATFLVETNLHIATFAGTQSGNIASFGRLLSGNIATFRRKQSGIVASFSGTYSMSFFKNWVNKLNFTYFKIERGPKLRSCRWGAREEIVIVSLVGLQTVIRWAPTIYTVLIWSPWGRESVRRHFEMGHSEWIPGNLYNLVDLELNNLRSMTIMW